MLESCAQTKSDCLRVGDILTHLRDASFQPPAISYYETYFRFDLINFNPVDGEGKSPNDYFKCGFDKRGKCVSVEHFERAPRLSNFKMNLYEFEYFRAYTFQVPLDTGYRYRPVFFIVSKRSRSAFMINISPQIGEADVGRHLHEELYVGDLKSLSAIMVLNDDFVPTSLVRLFEAKMIYGSVMKYESGSTYLEKERLFMFRNLANEYVPTISDTSCLGDLDAVFDRHYDLVFSAEPRIAHADRYMPLWVWGGAHGYER